MNEKDFTPHIGHREAVGMNDLMKAFVRHYNLSAGLNTHRIFEAWDIVSGAGKFTLRKFFRSGTLYVTISSSMVRSQLGFQKEALIRAVNEYLENDPLFQKDCASVGFVHELILK